MSKTSPNVWYPKPIPQLKDTPKKHQAGKFTRAYITRGLRIPWDCLEVSMHVVDLFNGKIHIKSYHHLPIGSMGRLYI